MGKKMRKRKISLKTEVKKERDIGSRGNLTIKKEKDIKTERIDTEEESHKKSKKKKKKHKKEKKKDKKTSKEKILEREIKEIKQELDIKQERESDNDCGPSPSKRRKKIGNKVIDDIVIMDSEDEAFKPAGSKLTSDTLAQIDEILFADIGKVQKVDKASNNLMSAVDKILGLGTLGEGTSRKGDDSIAATSEEEDSDSNQSSDEYSEGDNNFHSGERTRRSPSDYGEGDSDSVEGSEEEEELSEGEMRLLNMIKINKIDVKLNFPKAYSDTACHFCREPEDSEHLAQCPVYSAVMRGTEIEDIKSKDVGRVKRALTNIKAALEQRSKALSFTSVGDISQKNMQLLFPREPGSEDKMQGEKSKLVEQILEGS